MPRVKILPHELKGLGAEAEARITAELRKPLTGRKPRAKRGDGKVGREKLASALGSPLTLAFDLLAQKEPWMRFGLQTEFRFADSRKWRFDFAWPDRKVAVELDGGGWGTGPACPACKQRSAGRHTRGKGFEGDCEKLNTAAALGWTVLRYTMGMLKRPDALADLRAVLEAKR